MSPLLTSVAFEKSEDVDTSYFAIVPCPTPSAESSVDDNSLTTADIINIFLIAVCVILVLLAIAILIRLK